MSEIIGTVSNKPKIFGYKMLVSELEKDNVGNRTKVKIQNVLTTRNENYRFDTVGTRNMWIKVGGVKKADTTARIVCNPWQSNPYIVQEWEGWITHEADGKKRINISGYVNAVAAEFGPSICEASGEIELTTIPRTTKIDSFSDFIIGQIFKVKTIKYSSIYTDNLKIKLGTNLIKTISNYTSNQDITFTAEELSLIYSLMAMLNKSTFTAEITTKSGDDLIGTTTKNASGTIIDANPIFVSTDVTYHGTFDTSQFSYDNQVIIRNITPCTITVAAATAQKGASIISYETILNNVIKTKATSGDIVYDIVNSSEDLELTVKVTDSRGNITVVTKLITCVDYYDPIAKFDVKRANGFESNTTIKVSYEIASVNEWNGIISATINIYEHGSQTAFITINNVESDTEYVEELDKEKEWDIVFNLVEKIKPTITEPFKYYLPIGIPPFFVDVDKRSIGINCFPQHEKTVEVSGVVVMSSDGLLNCLQADSGNNWTEVGFIQGMGEYYKSDLNIDIYIPEDFVILKAFINFYHAPYYIRGIPNDDMYSAPLTDEWCYSRHVKLYKGDFLEFYRVGLYGSEYRENPNLDYEEVQNAFGTNGFTGTPPADPPTADMQNTVENVESIDISNKLTVGTYNYFKLETSDATPDYFTHFKDGIRQTGLGKATITILGYKK